MDVKVTAVTAGGSCWTHIGMYDVDTTVNDSTNKDFLGMIFIAESATMHIGLIDADGSLEGTLAPTAGTDDEIATGAQFYLRMTRTAANGLKLERFTTSARTTLVSAAQTRTLSGNPQGLDWFKITNRDSNLSGELNLKIENVKIWDNTNTPFVTQDSIMILNHRQTDGNSTNKLQLNGNTGSNYCFQYSTNGGNIGGSDGNSHWNEQHYTQGNDSFWIGFFPSSEASDEIIGLGYLAGEGSEGANNSPNMATATYKVVDTGKITRVEFFNDGSGDLGSGTNTSILGIDTPVSQDVVETGVDERDSLTNVPVGIRFEDISTRKILRKDTYGWKERNETTYVLMDSFRGCFCGGQASTNTIDYITIETAGNATDFGDLTGNTGAAAGCDNNSRGVIGHGSNNIMDYITIDTAGNATDFGDRTVTPDEIAGLSDTTTRGLFGGGTGSNNTMDYITIASAGNATDFGDLTAGRSALAGLGDTTRGCWGGGSTGSIVNTIDYVTIASAGNATDFGDLTQARRHLAATASETRGVFAGGHATYNNIDYITIQTAGNATDFGDLVNGRYGIAGVSNYARGVFGSSNVSGVSNQMDYITIATVGNATDFGDLTVARSNAGGVSGN